MSGQDRPFPPLSLLLPLLLALIPISLSPLHLRDPLSNSRPDNRTQTQTQIGNYIVRFLDYKIAGDHRSYLEEKLRSFENWRWVDRKNPASAFPTDFGVLVIGDSNRAAVIDQIQRLERVKDVYADSSYSRSLFVDDESEKGGSFLYEKKRPGKIVTPMSFGEEEWSYSPAINISSTGSWKRKILMEVQFSIGFSV